MSKLYHTFLPLTRPAFAAIAMAAGLLLVGGCKPASVLPVATTVPTLRPTPVVIIATLVPTPTATMTPTPVIAYDVQRLRGDWVLALDYRLLGYPYYSNIHYVGRLRLTVNDDGTLDGGGDIFTTLEQPPCNAIVTDGIDLVVSLSGQVVVSSNVGDTPIATLVITPADPAVTQSFQLDCRDARLIDKRMVALLWPSLAAIDQLQVQFPFKRGRVFADSRNLTAPSNGTIQGTLVTEIRVG